MKNYRNTSQNSCNDISCVLEDAFQLAFSKIKSDEQEKFIGQFADILENLLDDYVLVIRKYEILTLIHHRKIKENLKPISKNIQRMLKNLDIEPIQLQKLNSKDVTEIEKQIQVHQQQLQEINQKLSIEILALKKDWNEKILRIKQLVRIPDLARELKDREDLLSCMGIIAKYFESILDVEDKDQESLKTEWSQMEKKFSKYKNIESYEGIKKRYKFSDETLDFLKELLDEKKIPLSSLNPEILKEIKKFSDFCKNVRMSFQPEEVD
jgi:hypothetical protein